MCVVTGIGISNLYITTSEILSKHFDRYKYLAFSLAILGQFCGMIAWPVVSQELFSSNGYSDSMLIMGSIQLIHVVAGILFIEPSTTSDNINSKY